MADAMPRIPLSPDEEHTLGSMARWMRFMSVVGICGALLMLLLLIVGFGLMSSLHAAIGSSTDPAWAKLHAFLGPGTGRAHMLAIVVIAAVGVGLWQNMTLFRAGDDFNLVATTDTADLEYLSSGLDRLRLVFKLQVLMTAAAVALALVLATMIAAMYAAHQMGRLP